MNKKIPSWTSLCTVCDRHKTTKKEDNWPSTANKKTKTTEGWRWWIGVVDISLRWSIWLVCVYVCVCVCVCVYMCYWPPHWGCWPAGPHWTLPVQPGQPSLQQQQPLLPRSEGSRLLTGSRQDNHGMESSTSTTPRHYNNEQRCNWVQPTKKMVKGREIKTWSTWDLTEEGVGVFAEGSGHSGVKAGLPVTSR